MTTTLIRDYLDLPAHAQVDDFIVKPSSDATALARQYTLTSAIRPKLDTLLRDVHGVLNRNEDLGRFIFGSFGSGKSHFLRVAGMMLANDERLYDNARDPGLRELRSEHPWLDDAKILVVNVNMMTANPQPDGFTRQLVTEFDRALEALGHAPLHAFGTGSVFAEFDEFCQRAPGTFAAFEKQTGYDRAFYERKRDAAQRGEDVTDFARDVARFFVGSERRFEPTDSEAREQMAVHAASLGIRAIAFIIDEFVLWAQGLSGEGYAAAVNALNALVESADVKPVRTVAIAAIQRSIMTVFPDDKHDRLLREQLARAKDRFPQLELEDNNLFEIAERRVLVPRPELAEDWRRESARVARELGDAQRGVLVGDEAMTALEQLYPFHPALMRVLSDVTQGLHRDRSALYMLYQLITEVRPELRIGQLMSLGALWDVLFSPESVAQLETFAPKSDPSHHANRLLKTFQTWERLRPSIETASGGGRDGDVLDLVVKSALLAQLSHRPFLDATRGLDRAVTMENLFRLNRADITAMNETVGVMRVGELVAKLAAAETGTVVLDGTGPGAILRIELNAIDLTELLGLLRPPSMFSTLLARVKDALGFGAGFATGQDGLLKAPFRNTERSGHVRFESFDQLSTGPRSSTLSLEPSDDFKLAILIESEFTVSGQQTIDNARAKIESARDQVQSWAAAWIPGPLSQDGREALETLAKAELFESRPDDFLGRFRSGDHSLVRQRIGTMKTQAQAVLRSALQRAYREGGRVVTMRRDPVELGLAPNVEISGLAKHFAAQLLERRFPLHPKFGAAPSPSALSKLLILDRRLTADRTKNTLFGDEAELAKKLGEPLELFEPGFGVTNQRSGGTYLDRLREWIAGGETRVTALIDRCGKDPLGLQRSPAQLLIAILASRDGYRLLDGTRPIAIEAVGDVDPRAIMARGHLPSLAAWNGGRTAASTLFAVTDISAAHTVGSADMLVVALREPIARTAATLRRCVQAFETLAKRGVFSGTAPLGERYKTAERDLHALDDETKVIERLASLDLQQNSRTFAAASEDAPALEALVEFENLEVVLAAAPDLRERLRSALTADIASIAGDLRRWRDTANEWVTSRIKDAVVAPSSGNEPRPDVPVVQLGSVPRTNGAQSAFPLSFKIRVPVDDDDLLQLTNDVKKAIETVLSRGESGATSVRLEFRIVEDVSTAT